MSNLKFVALSGTTGVTENMYVYEYGGDMIIVDCGVGFPDASMYGVDLVIPDFSYVVKRKDKIRGLLVTHGHEDHLGAIPYLLDALGRDIPIYASRLTAGFIEDKLIDRGKKNVKVNIFNPEKDTIALGVFRITPFRVSHSVPDSCGFCIDTPEGKCFHVPDYKFDWTPVGGKTFDISKLALLASEGTLLLASDSLGSTHPGFTDSEIKIEGHLKPLIEKAVGKVFFTTISSNISRMQQALNIAQKEDRKVALVGRSIIRKAEIARKLGYLHYPKGLIIDLRKSKKVPARKIMYIISGSYGQAGSALYRVITGDHDFLQIESEDTVIFSADPAPPGSKTSVDYLVDRLIENDVDVHYYDTQENLHVSGHGSQEDIKLLFGIVRPKFFIPIGGTIRHNRGYREIAINMGAKSHQVLELSPGDIVDFKNGKSHKGKRIPIKEVLVDGLGVGDVGNVVLRDRRALSQDGIVIALIQYDRNIAKLINTPELITRGFVFEKKEKQFLKETAKKLGAKLSKKPLKSTHVVRASAIDYLEKYLYNTTGRRPMILPVVVGV